MRFITMKELRSKAATLRRDLAREEVVVLTANGKPVGLFTPVDGDQLEEELAALRRARAQAAIDRIRKAAAEKGVRDMLPAEIEEIVLRTRRERNRPGQGG